MPGTLREYIGNQLEEATSGLQAVLYVVPRNIGLLNFERALHRILDCRSALAEVTDANSAIQHLSATSGDLRSLLSGPAESSVAEAIRVIDETIAAVAANAWST